MEEKAVRSFYNDTTRQSMVADTALDCYKTCDKNVTCFKNCIAKNLALIERMRVVVFRGPQGN